MFIILSDTMTPQIYSLSLHDALPIWIASLRVCAAGAGVRSGSGGLAGMAGDRKSTRLNSSHVAISYAVFCLKKKRRSTLTVIIIRVIIMPKHSMMSVPIIIMGHVTKL